MSSASRIYDSLVALLPSQFDEVILRAGVPQHHLLDAHSTLAMRATQLVQWATQSPANEKALIEALDHVSTVRPDARHDTTATGGRPRYVQFAALGITFIIFFVVAVLLVNSEDEPYRVLNPRLPCSNEEQQMSTYVRGRSGTSCASWEFRAWRSSPGFRLSALSDGHDRLLEAAVRPVDLRHGTWKKYHGPDGPSTEVWVEVCEALKNARFRFVVWFEGDQLSESARAVAHARTKLYCN
jgi:hypothetical protein